MSIPDVDRETIEQALHEFDEQKRKEWAGWESNQNYRYALLWENRRYPVKEIIRMATGAEEFSGGRESNRYLETKGFEVIDIRNDKPSIWKISAGEGGKYWKDFYGQNLIGIGFEEHFQGDLTPFSNFEDLFATISQKDVSKPKYVAEQFWAIHQGMQEGDIVFAYGSGALRGKGRIIGPYQFEVTSTFPYPHQRLVEWDKSFKEVPTTSLSQSLQNKLKKQETIIPLTQAEYEEIIGKPTIVLLDALSNYFASKGYSFPPGLLATFITALQTKGFVILSGLSGTGKTKLAQHLAELLPGPQETTEIPKETTEEGDIYIQVQPYMLKYARIIIPKSNWQLIDVPPAGESAEVTVSFDSKNQKCRLIHAVYAGDYLQLLLKGQARKWFVENFEPDDSLILQPQTSPDDNEFTGFSFLKPQAIPPIQRPRLPNHVFVSVRPDWRDAKSLLGYFNPITDEYVQTNFLQFLLQAKTHYDQAGAEALPHFVILDEMNLARVEYYFADLLSILESGRNLAGYTRESITLHNRPLERSLDTRGQPIPQSLALPPNLCIIGTVNMDETTHAFSPKVLDRAFTIEFNEVDFSNYPPQPSAIPQQIETTKLQMALLASFQRSGKFAQIDKAEIAEIVRTDEQGYCNHLQTLNQLLTGFDLHFGYRVFDEIAQFMAIANKGNLFDNLNTAFDLAVLMKVLPKFNGPRSRIRLPLETIIAWAKNPLTPTPTNIASVIKDADSCRSLLAQLPAEYSYPETARKALRMLIRLHETGFASFA